MRIRNTDIGPGHPVYIIAEAGSNHAGRLDLAHELLDIASRAGANAIKYQLWEPRDIIVGGLVDHKFGDIKNWLADLRKHAHDVDLDFIVTPFSGRAVVDLWEYVDAWKIASFEAECDWVKMVLADERPKFISLGQTDDATWKRYYATLTCKNVIPCHCVSKYPTPFEEAGLSRLHRMGPIRGYSSHTSGWSDVLAARAMGALVIEKHFRLAQQPDAPDNLDHSLPPHHLNMMIRDLREIDAAMLYRGEFIPSEPPAGRIVHGVKPCSTSLSSEQESTAPATPPTSPVPPTLLDSPSEDFSGEMNMLLEGSPGC